MQTSLLPRGLQHGFRYHLGIVKPLLLTLLRNAGADGVLVGWTGTTDEAIAAVNADPRNVFVMDRTCDRQGPSGECLGHPVGEPQN